MSVTTLILFSVLAGHPVVEDALITDFDTTVLPVLTKTGCNAAACHGSAAGRGGFHLSLYGSDPAADFLAISREREGRRINIVSPDDSLLLRKPSGLMKHGGGMKLKPNSAGMRILQQWITQGAKRSRSRKLIDLEIQPSQTISSSIEKSIDLKVFGKFDDGFRKEVTKWAIVKAENEAAVTVGPNARLTIRRPGRQIVLVRYLDRVLSVEILVPYRKIAVDFSQEPRQNFIDDLVFKKLAKLRIPVSATSKNPTFLRRATLKLAGRLPTLEEIESFRQNTDPKKRERLVSRLLKSESFNDYWTWQLANSLRIRSRPASPEGTKIYLRWLHDRVSKGTSYDRIARTLILAKGDSSKYGPANFYRTTDGPRKQAEFVSELFMGARLKCANCHDHPLDRWKQNDYHGFAAIFAKVESGRDVKINPRGRVIHPKTGMPAEMKIPGIDAKVTKADPREEFADWLLDKHNPYFAKVIVNRLWKSMMGRGLVEPADDFRDTNPATHPKLLERLATDFTEHGYDIRHTLRTIADSATFQRSMHTVEGNQFDRQFYSHFLSTPLAAEILSDAIGDVTGIDEKYGKSNLTRRAIQIVDTRTPLPSLDILGRCSRESSCVMSGTVTSGLSLNLHLLNGKLLNEKIGSPHGRLGRFLKAKKNGLEIVRSFYLLAFSREPTTSEKNYWQKQLQGKRGNERKSTLEDFLWGLLSSQEFQTNH